MKLFVALALSGCSTIALCGTAAAQTAPPAVEPERTQDTTGVPSDEAEANTGEIVVTARRRAESLQDVPQTINAVSGETVEKLNILRFEEISSVVPGLTLSSGEGGVNPSASLRGVTFRVDSSAPPTVALYLNEAPVNAGFLFQSLFDIGQIEVLRGPQGTLRGISAPSGSITVSTRKPDFDGVGGYVNMTGSTRGAINGQGALNIPLISDVLAIRVAGVVDQNQANGVTSINSGIDPHNNTVAGRVSVLFRPFDALTAAVTYQHVDQDLRTFRQVVGPGSPGGGTANTPANYNGTAIVASDRLGVGDRPSLATQKYDIVTGQVDLALGSQKLSYVGMYLNSSSNRQTASDFVNQLVGADPYDALNAPQEETSHELRLSSLDPIGIFNYTVGAFYNRAEGGVTLGFPAAFLPGTFGTPAAPSPAIYDPRYVLPLTISGENRTSEVSVFANLTAQLGSRTELSLGGRYIISNKRRASTLGVLGSAIVAVELPVPASFCTTIGAVGNTYAGTCDFPVPGGDTVISANDRQDNSPFIYTASISHRFSDDFLVYANTGTSFRRGPTNSIGINNGGNDPVLATLLFLPNETSRSYEVGFKSTFLDRRLRFNVAAFHQNFENYIFRTLPTPYLSNTGTALQVLTTTFTAPVDAVVDGIDIDASFQVSPNFSIGGAFSYSDGRIADDLAPCRDANFDGTPDTGTPTVEQFQAAGSAIALCTSNQSISQSPIWNLSVQSEFTAPVSNRVDGFLRGLLTYFPDNPRASEGFTADSYGILNVYAGIRSPDGEWEVSAFAKNALNTQTLLSRDFGFFNLNGLASTFGPSGYNAATYTPLREFGLNIRYAFGTR